MIRKLQNHKLHTNPWLREFSYLFVKIKYSTTSRCIVIITNHRRFHIFKLNRNRTDNIFTDGKPMNYHETMLKLLYSHVTHGAYGCSAQKR